MILSSWADSARNARPWAFGRRGHRALPGPASVLLACCQRVPRDESREATPLLSRRISHTGGIAERTRPQ